MDDWMRFTIVRVIVHAKDEQEALIEGKKVLAKIAYELTVHGIYITYEDKELLDDFEVEPIFPPVLLASSPEGMQLIEEGWQCAVEAFMDALEKVKLAVRYLTPEQIMEEDSLGLGNLSEELKRKISFPCIREQFLEVGGRGEDDFKLLYFEELPITRRRRLNDALNPSKGLTAYVIPAAFPN